MQRVFDASLLFLHLGLGRGADIDDGHSTGEFRQAFLQFFLVVVRGGFLDLTADLVDTALDFTGLAAACHQGRVFPIHHDGFGAAEVFETDRFELDAEVFGDALATSEDRNIFHHRFAAIAEAGGLDGADANCAAQFVYDQRREGFAFDIFGNDQQRLAGLGDLFEDGQQLFDAADLPLVIEDVSIFELGFHRLRVGDEVGREIALVELHAFHNFQRGLDRLRFFNRNSAVLAYFVHGVSDDFANGRVPVGRDGGDLFDLFLVLDLFGDPGEMIHGCVHRLLDAALNANRVPARGDKFQTFPVNRLGEQCGSG